MATSHRGSGFTTLRKPSTRIPVATTREPMIVTRTKTSKDGRCSAERSSAAMPDGSSSTIHAPTCRDPPGPLSRGPFPDNDERVVARRMV